MQENRKKRQKVMDQIMDQMDQSMQENRKKRQNVTLIFHCSYYVIMVCDSYSVVVCN